VFSALYDKRLESLCCRYVSSNIHLQGANRVDDFCAIIRGPRHKLLRIICSASEIWHSSEQILPVFKEHSRVTLLDLLKERARDRANAHVAPVLSKKKKKIIAVILAKSLLKLFGSRWLQEVWNAESIFFLPDLNTSEIADFQMPYISCSLVSKSSDESEMVDYERYYPFIFAFGILLLELELDQSISVTMDDEEQADEDSPPIYMALLRMFLLRKEDLDDAYLLQIINSCLEFGNRVESIKHPSFNNDLKLRAAILKYIVQPLIQRLQAAHSEVSLDTLVVPQHPVGVKSPRTFAGYDGQSSSGLFAQEATTTYCPGKSFSLKAQPILPTQAVGRAESISSSTRTSTPTWNSLRPRHRRNFKIAIICALPLEADAVKALFDERWDANGDIYGKAWGDRNAYSTGVIGRHNVVLAHMPGMGKESAASVAADCRSSFEGIKLALVVGICGGVPFAKQDEEILLGDVVISEGIIPYDFGRLFPDQFVRKDTVLDNLGRPSAEIRALLAKLKGRSDRRNLQNKISEYLTVLHKELGETATYPGTGEDKLFDPRYRHKHQISSSCAICAACSQRSDPICEAAFTLTCEQLKCDDHKLIPRHRLGTTGGEAAISGQTVHQPMVHFGLVASGNMVIKSGEDRDQIAAREDVIAFEMEGAGVWDNFPCLVIKGVCDYADSHKSKRWQNYAAATAAACMKAFLENWVTSNSGP
jgi:nucleoside phosphorylase